MADFKLEKNGYDKSEVDNFLRSIVQDFENRLQDQKLRISDLKRELESVNSELMKFRQKNENISDALVVAVETAKKIENNSKTMYELEIQRLRNLYQKWETVLDEFLKEYPKLQNEFDTKILLQKFSDGINEVIEQNTVSIDEKKEEQSRQNPAGLKALINRMGGATFSVNKTTGKVKVEEILPKQGESEKAEEIKPIKRNPKPSEETMVQQNLEKNYAEESKRLKSQIKPIGNLNLDQTDAKYGNLMEQFLSADDSTEDNAYTKAVINSSKPSNGFDLKEALNPKEDLEEIMKSFSFFPNKDDDKKTEKNKK